MVKTNVMRVLDKEKIAYEPFSYSSELTEGVKIAEVLGEEPACVFKTLVTESGDKEHFVFVIPVAETLDLKAGGARGGCKISFNVKAKGAFAAYGLYSRRLLACGYEEKIQNSY